MKHIHNIMIITTITIVFMARLPFTYPDMLSDDDDDNDGTDDEIADDEEAAEVMLAILGHAKRPNPNKANSVSGRSEHVQTYMANLFNDVKTHDMTHNSTKGAVDFFDFDTGSDGEKRNKRNTQDIADTAISFVPESFSARPNATDIKDALYFDMRTDYDTASNLFSELRLFFKNKNNIHRLFTLMLYEIKTSKTHKLIHETKITRNKSSGDWLSLNVTKVVSSWFDNPNTNHGLLLRAKNKRGKLVPIGRVGLITSTREKKQPFILSFLKTNNPTLLTDEIFERIKSSKRKRRDVNFNEMAKKEKTMTLIRRARIKYKKPKQATNQKPPCRPITFDIDFEAMNWHRWIISPKNYASKRCEGSCSFPIEQRENSTSHALIQSLQSLMTGGKFPEACCAPYKMSPLHLFMYDRYGNAVIKEHVNMIVESCGCQ